MFHHVFLPANLPQEVEYHAEYECVPLDTVIRALQGFQVHLPTQQLEIIAAAVTMISLLREMLVSHINMIETSLKSALNRLDTYNRPVSPDFIHV